MLDLVEWAIDQEQNASLQHHNIVSPDNYYQVIMGLFKITIVLTEGSHRDNPLIHVFVWM